MHIAGVTTSFICHTGIIFRMKENMIIITQASIENTLGKAGHIGSSL